MSFKEEALKLNDEKKKIESQISEWKSVLDGEKNVGMDGPLVDNEGYPRNDIDVHKIRIARQKIICLSNDHKSLMTKLADLLNKIHENQASNNGAKPDAAEEEPMEETKNKKPFAKIDLVTTGSPAHDAGLKAGDMVVEFGTQNHANFKALADIGQLVQNSENRSIRVQVLRSNQILTLSLVPKKWSGQGLLGCKIIPSNIN